ncbi:MAG: branched-chain amino acid transport system ATP-binding protein [Methylobacteriaceae bacterium]|nr:branched-chain amino acid transport system ATP-binding protein [Methylobacteriaceae bacterium]
MAPDALRLEDVHSFYGESHVLQGVSFALKSGQLLALLGRNGAGKTTCVTTVLGFLTPKRGDIRLFDQSIVGQVPEAICRRGIALVPQGRRVFPSLSVRENLDVARRAAPGRATSWSFERVYTLFPRLRERQNQFAGSLSGGEQQMLAIGRALMGNPKVLLLDEPSEGLAPLIVAELGLALGLLKSEGQSILLVEQNSKLALQLADEVVILTTGRCVFRGTAAEVRDNETLLAQNLGVVMSTGRR